VAWHALCDPYLMNPFSKRVKVIEPPAPINPVTNRPYGEPVAERDEAADAQLAAGQLALANAIAPEPPAVGFRPNGGWAGARG